MFPVPADFPQDLMLLLCDILPTGYSCAYTGRRLLDEDDKDAGIKDGVAVVIGCGPVSRYEDELTPGRSLCCLRCKDHVHYCVCYRLVNRTHEASREARRDRPSR